MTTTDFALLTQILAHVFEASETTHQRAVNKLCYHPRDANILLSGSQDHTMCCFVSSACLVLLSFTVWCSLGHEAETSSE